MDFDKSTALLIMAAGLIGCTVHRAAPPQAAAPVEPPPHVCAPVQARGAEPAGGESYGLIAVAVMDDASGSYVSGLGKDDFKVYAYGQQLPVEFFASDASLPASVGILVDASGSMQPKLEQARAAISQFVGGLDKQDAVLLFAFSDRAFLLQPITTEHSLVTKTSLPLGETRVREQAAEIVFPQPAKPEISG